MPKRNDATILDVDADAVVAATREAVDGPLYSLVEFDAEEFNTLYVADETLAMYDSEDRMLAHFGKIHNYVHLDFTEKNLFTEELIPVADRVRFVTTALDTAKLVRVFVDDAGCFFALPADAEAERVARVLEDATDTV